MTIARSIQPGLERITRLLDETPLPWRAIHVGGTNGKGSVCVYISAMLDVYNRSDYRKDLGHEPVSHARFTSPHLVHYLDGITIKKNPPRSRMVSKWHEHLRAKNESEGIGAGEFELLTATAFECFTRHRGRARDLPLDIGVVEVGMGGRDDATNIIGQPHPRKGFRAPPLVTAFTKIGLDHQDFLGNSLAEITKNKAGIMKPDVPVVFDTSNDKEVIQVLTEEAGDRCDEANVPPLEILRNYTFEGSGRLFAAIGKMMNGLPAHTKHNLELAFKATWVALQRLSRIRVDHNLMPEHMRPLALILGASMLRVHKKVSFPGRLQQLSIAKLTKRAAPILLDGAHNEQSAQVLAEAVRKLRERHSASITWVIAASSTKDVRTILKHILQDGDTVMAVEFGPVQGMPWVKPMSTRDIMSAADDVASVKCIDRGSNVIDALLQATETANEGPMVVAGSLYLVGDVLRLLEQNPHGLEAT